MRTIHKIAIAVLLPAALMAQRTQTLKVDVNMVNVNVRVTDKTGRTVLGLGPDDFEVYEDRIAQKIEDFSTEEVPASIGLIFDVSGSMEPVMDGARKAATDFLNMGTNQDEFFLITFRDRPHVEVEFTRDITKLQSVLLFTQTKGSTALWDAMYLGIEKLRKGQNPRKALVCITDGDNNHSRYSQKDFAEVMREQDVQIFYLDTDTAKKLDGEKIATSLKSQYLLSYRSTNTSTDGKWRDIRVRVKTVPGMPPLTVTSRTGYYAPLH
jgi:Ca-activated chloride channel homolog